jgi:hypothetical protein
MKPPHIALLSLLLILFAQPLVATTYYVTAPLAPPCTTKTGGFVTFPSIQYAVTHAPEGSTINICPGTYYEQVTISQPLTLKGVSYNNSSQVIIAVPSSGLTTTSSILLGSVEAQIQVTAGPVNITNISVVGSQTLCGSENTVGIFYSSGSSGIVDEVQSTNQNCNNSGVGILAENGAGPNKSVTIENSNMQFNTYFGIAAVSSQTTPTLTASIKNNSVVYSFDGIFVLYTDGSISNNVIDASCSGCSAGIVTFSASSPVSGNTVFGDGVFYAIDVEAGDKVSDNIVRVSASSTGIFVDASGAEVLSNHITTQRGDAIELNAAGATVQTNTINSISGIGIEFNCHANTVSGNIINGSTYGIDAPAAYTGVNTFYNAATIRANSSGC